MKKIYCIFIFLLFQISAVHSQALTGMTPNTIVQGQTSLAVTITGPGVFLQTSSQNGNVLEMHLQQGATNIPIYYQFGNINPSMFTYHDSCHVTINFPVNISSGIYDLSTLVGAICCTQSYTLNTALTVVAADGYAQGNIYEDLNLNGVKDLLDSNLSFQTIIINPGNYTMTTDANGMFSYPLPNNTYEVSWQNNINNCFFISSDSSSYTFTINNGNVSNLDFGLHRTLRTITPNSMVKGNSTTTIIESRNLFTGTGFGNLSWICIKKNGSFVNGAINSLNIIDSNTVTVNFNATVFTPFGLYNLEVRLSNGERHYLPASFTVLAPEAFLRGKVYFDANSNGIYDTGEPDLSYQRVLVEPDSSFNFSGNLGNFDLGVFYGAHTVKWSPLNTSTWYLSSDSASYSVNALSDIDSLDFGLRSTNPIGTIDVVLTSSLRRCNSNHIHTINYTNKCNNQINATVYFIKSPFMSSVTSTPSPSSINGDTLIWNLSNIHSFENNSINIYSYYPAAGSIVTGTAIIRSVDNLGNTLFSDTSAFTDHVICALDPNDKSVIPEGVGSDYLTMSGDLLDYTIRFQNTGNDTALNVIIYDNLDQNLDYNTLQVIASSHSVQTEVNTDGRVVFTFANILLPDSNINEPASNGFVRYTILPKAGLSDSTVVNNQAFIVFDTNPAVVTNKTTNTYVYIIPVGLNDVIVDDISAIIYPNPFSDFTNIIFNNANNENYILKVYDVSGKIVQQRSTNSGRILLERENMKSGIYFYTLMNTAGTKKLSGKIITE